MLCSLNASCSIDRLWHWVCLYLPYISISFVRSLLYFCLYLCLTLVLASFCWHTEVVCFSEVPRVGQTNGTTDRPRDRRTDSRKSLCYRTIDKANKSAQSPKSTRVKKIKREKERERDVDWVRKRIEVSITMQPLIQPQLELFQVNIVIWVEWPTECFPCFCVSHVSRYHGALSSSQ